MAQLNTTCPTCGAPHARKLSVIHSEGFSTVQTNINTVGTMNTIGRQKITTKGTATAVQQTQASKDAARPIVPKLTSAGRSKQAGIVFAAIFIGIVGTIAGYPICLIVGLAMSMCTLLIDGDPTPEEIVQYNKATQDVRARADLWDKTFQCGACSYKFVPSEVQAA